MGEEITGATAFLCNRDVVYVDIFWRLLKLAKWTEHSETRRQDHRDEQPCRLMMGGDTTLDMRVLCGYYDRILSCFCCLPVLCILAVVCLFGLRCSMPLFVFMKDIPLLFNAFCLILLFYIPHDSSRLIFRTD